MALPQLQTKTNRLHDVQLKMDSDIGEFTGYACVYNGLDSVNDTILPGAFDSVIERGEMPLMFFNHDGSEVPPGVWKSMESDDTGLLMTGQLLDGHSKANDIRLAMKAGALTGLSIGFRMTKEDREEKNGIRYIKNVSQLVETSIVTFPADKSARIDVDSVKSATGNFSTLKEYERYLRDAGGFSKTGCAALLSGIKTVLSESKTEADEVLDLVKNFKLGA